MRIELSPWEVAETSFHHGGGAGTEAGAGASSPMTSPTKRRRQQSDSLSKCKGEEKLLSVSFIEQTSSSRRSRKKRKDKKGRPGKASSSAEEEDRTPVLTVTSSHRIAVMVENDTVAGSYKNSSSTGTGISVGASKSLQESSILQFASRPSKTTAFLPLDSDSSSNLNGTSTKHFGNNNSHKSEERHANAALPLIPAVFDAQQNRVYALQKNNAKLVSYVAANASSSSESANEAVSSCISVHLEHAASSLSLIHLPHHHHHHRGGTSSSNSNTAARCIVYGTCQDGRIFVACCSPSATATAAEGGGGGGNANHEEQLLVEYIDTTSRSSLVDPHQQHVGTLAHLLTRTGETQQHAGTKRKMDDPSSDETGDCCSMIMFHQLFLEDRGIALVRQKVRVTAPVAVVLPDVSSTTSNDSSSSQLSWVTAVAGPPNQKPAVSVNLMAPTTATTTTDTNHCNNENNGAPPRWNISHASALGFVEGTDAISLFYRTTAAKTPTSSVAAARSASLSKPNGGKAVVVAAITHKVVAATAAAVNVNEQSFYAAISLRTGRLIGAAPVALPANTQQVGLVGPALLAALTADREIVLFDTIRGARVYACRPPLPAAAVWQGGNDNGNSNNNSNNRSCTLVADSKRSRLAIVFRQVDRYAVAVASVYADNDDVVSSSGIQSLLRGPRLSLAAGLASSLTVQPALYVAVPTRRLVSDKSLGNISKENVQEQKAIAKGVQLLENAYRKVCDGSKEAMEPSFFLEAYSVALKVAQGVNASHVNGRNEDNPQDAVLSKNGKKTNGINHSPANKNGIRHDVDAEVTGHTHHTRPHAIPQAFLESATSIAIAILGSSETAVIDSAVRNDARLVLRRLVRSGKVSARTHLVPRTNMRKTSGLMGLLRALELSTEEAGTWSAYTPFDLANDLFCFCPDVSERQMLAAVHYTMSRALPRDIASFFARDKRVGEQHRFLRRSARFTALDSKRHLSANEKEKLTLMSHKLIISGTAFLIQRVTDYSKCNVTLLRDAIESELNRDEVQFLARCFMDMLTAPDKFRLLAPKAGAMGNALQYLSALCDSLQGSVSEDEGKTFSRIRSALSAEISKTGIILSLHKTVQESVEFIGFGAAGRSEASEQVINDKKPSTSLPPYQIERLVF